MIFELFVAVKLQVVFLCVTTLCSSVGDKSTAQEPTVSVFRLVMFCTMDDMSQLTAVCSRSIRLVPHLFVLKNILFSLAEIALSNEKLGYGFSLYIYTRDQNRERFIHLFYSRLI
jgi:hypothetical protein